MVQVGKIEVFAGVSTTALLVFPLVLIVLYVAFKKTKSSVNKCVWIVGASSGIGEALAYEEVKRRCKKIVECNEGDVVVVPLDVTEPLSHEAKYEEIKGEGFQVDVVVYCSGISHYGRFSDTSSTDMVNLINTNLCGAVSVIKLVINDMLERKSGHIIGIGSAKGFAAMGGSSAYSASKFGLRGLFGALSVELEGTGVFATLISTGYVNTDLKCINDSGDVQGVSNYTKRLRTLGYDVTEFAGKVTEASYHRKDEVVFGHWKVHLGLFLQRFAPLLYKLIIKGEWKAFQKGKI